MTSALLVASDDAPVLSDVWSYVEEAHRLRRSGDHPAALEAFLRALEGAPFNDDLRLEVARTLTALGRLPEGLAAADDVLSRRPRDGWAAIERGLILQRLGRHNEALATLEVAVAALPAHRPVLILAAHAAGCAGAAQRALELANEALLRAPEDADLLIEVAAIKDKAGSDADPDLILSARDLDQFNPRLVHALSSIRRPWADRLLVEDFKAALASGRDDYVLAVVQNLGSGSAAGPFVEVLASEFRKCGRAFTYGLELGELAYDFRDYGLAGEALDAAIRLEPASVSVRLLHSQTFWATGDRARAARGLADLLRDLGTRVPALKVALRFAMDLCAWPLACRIADALKAAGAYSLPVVLDHAIALAHSRDLETAITALDGAGRTPDAEGPLLATKLHLMRLFGRHRHALELIGSEPELLTRDPGCWIEASGLLVETGRSEALNALLTAPPVALEARAVVGLRRGEERERQRDYVAAGKHYASAAALAPNQEVLTRLARCKLLRLEIEAATAHARAALSVGAPEGTIRNLSQSHLGQLIEEFSLDAELVSELTAALELPGTMRLDALAKAMREAPDQTAPAVSLLLELRRAGVLPSHMPKGTGRRRKIPKVIIQYWDTETPPPDVQALIDETSASSPGWRSRLFNFKSALEFLRNNHRGEVVRAFVRAATPQQQADVFRLAYLAARGGVYIDADDLVLADLSGIVDVRASLFCYQDIWGAIANDVLGSAPGHPVIQLALEKCVEAFTRGDHENPWLCSGPGLISRAFAARWVEDPKASWTRLCQALEHQEALGWVSIHHPAAYKSAARVDPEAARILETALDT